MVRSRPGGWPCAWIGKRAVSSGKWERKWPTPPSRKGSAGRNSVRPSPARPTTKGWSRAPGPPRKTFSARRVTRVRAKVAAAKPTGPTARPARRRRSAAKRAAARTSAAGIAQVESAGRRKTTSGWAGAPQSTPAAFATSPTASVSSAPPQTRSGTSSSARSGPRRRGEARGTGSAPRGRRLGQPGGRHGVSSSRRRANQRPPARQRSATAKPAAAARWSISS